MPICDNRRVHPLLERNPRVAPTNLLNRRASELETGRSLVRLREKALGFFLLSSFFFQRMYRPLSSLVALIASVRYIFKGLISLSFLLKAEARLPFLHTNSVLQVVFVELPQAHTEFLSNLYLVFTCFHGNFLSLRISWLSSLRPLSLCLCSSTPYFTMNNTFLLRSAKTFQSYILWMLTQKF